MMLRLLFGVCLITGPISITFATETPHRGLKKHDFLRSHNSADVKFLIRRLRKGSLGAGGLALVARLDERSVSVEPELKEKLELSDTAGLDTEIDYAFDLDAPTYQRSKVVWLTKPAGFEFLLTWTSEYKELFDGPTGHIRVKVSETFILNNVARPAITKRWTTAYELDRDVTKEKEDEYKRLNATVVAPARAQILKDIREFMTAKTRDR